MIRTNDNMPFLVFWLILGVTNLARCAEPMATPVTSIAVQPGFRVELLRSAGKGEGSWISMTFDHRSRLIVGPDDAGIARITLADDPAKVEFEVIENELRHCRGVLYAHDSLYVSATDSKGFYRLRDTTGDDRFDEVRLLKTLDYRSRYGHGSNQVVLGPDKMIYLVNGNDVSIPEGVSATSPYRDPRNDHLLPNPHDAGQDSRVGHILRTDPDGMEWEVIAGGFRNPFDIAFDAEGEMFTFDADMEWDVGQPWYRPTRVNHVVLGGEYGWRWGTGKWPDYFEDSLPTTLDTGLGSPTGMAFGTHSRFPPRYQDAMFMADWQNGRILLVDLIPSGASFRCRYDVFLEGGPLNVCDLEFGPDGALYFITGGRGSQSGLYRVVATDEEKACEPTQFVDSQVVREARAARLLRRHLESFHVRRDTKAIDEIFPHLNSDDRWLRFAARRAIENQDLAAWRQRALNETRPAAAIAALVALCRSGDASDRDAALSALNRIELSQLKQGQLIALLRAYELCFIRLGRPDTKDAAAVTTRLAKRYPHPTSNANHLLCELLVYLRDETVVAKTVKRLQDDSTEEEQIRAARTLTHARVGWTMATRLAVIRWLQHARTFRGGRQLNERIRDIRDDFLATFSEDERHALSDEIARLDEPLATETTSPARPFVRQWTMEDLDPRLSEVASSRSYPRGRRALLAANCLKCHRIGTTGAQIGPDLTRVGGRLDTRAILESILTPSKVMDPKYRHWVYILTSGKAVTGRPIGVNRTTITVETDPLRQTTVAISRADIEESFPATISPMPSGLVDVLTMNEILDLLAMLISGGNPDDGAFRASAKEVR